MTTDGTRAAGWKRFQRLAGALALPAIAALGFGAATVYADGPPGCGGGPDRAAHEGCGDRDHRCEPDDDCDRGHDRDRDDRPTPTPMPVVRPPLPEPVPVLAAGGATSPGTPVVASVAGAAAAAAGSPPVSSTTAPMAAPSPSPSPSPAAVQPVALVPVRPAPGLVDLPLVRLLVIAVVVGVAAAAVPRAVRWPR